MRPSEKALKLNTNEEFFPHSSYAPFKDGPSRQAFRSAAKIDPFETRNFNRKVERRDPEYNAFQEGGYTYLGDGAKSKIHEGENFEQPDRLTSNKWTGAMEKERESMEEAK